MQHAMVWFDHSEQRDLITKIRRASEYYYDTRGTYPNECHLHPEMAGEHPPTIPGMTIKTNPLVYREHFAVGIADESADDTADPAVG